MQSNLSKEALKAKAKALRTRLADMNIALTHQQALEAVAGLEGETSWSALAAKTPKMLNRAQVETLLRQRAPLITESKYGREPTLFAVLKTYYFKHDIEKSLCEQFANEYVNTLLDDVFVTQPGEEPKRAVRPVKASHFQAAAKTAEDEIALCNAETSDDAWLRALEAALRKLGKDETDVDELVYDVLGDQKASVVNNQGLREQLKNLFAWHRKYFDSDTGAQRAMLSDLEKHLGTRLPALAGVDNVKTSSKESPEVDDVHITIRPMKQLLDAGFAPEGIRLQAEKHLQGLQALGSEVEGKAEAIAATKQFIAELDAKIAADQ
jgi:hypothetical protein